MDIDKLCKVKVIDGKMFLCSPNGEVLPHQITGRLTDDCLGDIPTMFVRLLVDIRELEK